MTIYSKIIGTGKYLPERCLTNDDIARKVDTSDEWIVTRTGIKQRHIIAPDESTASMAAAAARHAIEYARINPADVDLIIVATSTADACMPSTACTVQAMLGIQHCPAFDLNAACSGFMYAMHVANQFIRSGQSNYALIIGSDAFSRIIDWNDRSTCVLFGDGAGAFVLGASNEPGVISTHLHADGEHRNLLKTTPLFDEHASQHAVYVRMQGRPLFKMAVSLLGDIVDETLEKNGFSRSDIDWLVPHQANLRIIRATADRLNLSMDRVVVTLDRHANTSAASIPLAFDVAVRDGRIRAGDTVLFEAFGAGLTWGSALVVY